MLLPLWLLAAGPTLWYQLLTAHFRPLSVVERVGMSIPLGFTTQAWLAALLGSYRGMLDARVLFFTALNLTALAAYAARGHSVRFSAALAGELRRNVNQAVALGLAVLPALFLSACFATGALTELDTGEVFVTAGMEKGAGVWRGKGGAPAHHTTARRSHQATHPQISPFTSRSSPPF